MNKEFLYIALAAATVLPGLTATSAYSGDPGPVQEVLPDLRQLAPASVRVAEASGEWRIGFDSEVANDGPGYLKIRGTGPGNAPMTADQIIQMSDGTETTLPGIGTMHYVIGGGHEHWHLLDFERYELRTTDGTQTIVKDEKTGFCLADAFTDDICGRNHPEYTSVSEGIDPGGSDKYLAYLEGQYLKIDPVTVPAGQYLLVHRTNPTGALKELNPGNDAASMRLSIAWSPNGTPLIKILNTCPGSIDCSAPPEPLPPPATGPQTGTSAPDNSQPQQQVAPAPGPVEPTAEPQTVPVVAAPAPPVHPRATMSRSMAARLVRQAIRKSTKQQPRNLRVRCERLASAKFACSAGWATKGSGNWGGKVRVWYRLADNGRLSWFYNLSATQHPGGKKVETRAARGSASRYVFASTDNVLVCRPVREPGR